MDTLIDEKDIALVVTNHDGKLVDICKRTVLNLELIRTLKKTYDITITPMLINEAEKLYGVKK